MEKNKLLEIIIEYLVIKKVAVEKSKYKFKTKFYKISEINNIINNSKIDELLKLSSLEKDYKSFSI